MAVLDWNAAEKAARGFSAGWGADEPGGAVIVFDASGPRVITAGGLESLSTRAPFTEESVVRYASVTKHAFAALVLAHRDVIALEDPLWRHLPELQPPLSDVTVGQALDMTGGLPDVRECLTLLGLSVFTETKSGPLLEFLFRMSRLNFPAGAEISYSNTGYRLVEAALERRGIFFRDYIRDEGKALGVRLDAPDVWNDPVDGLVPGYWYDGKGWQLSAAGLHISASGSMTGSVTALARWVGALMMGAGGHAGLFDQLAKSRHFADGRETGYGLGIRQVALGSRMLYGHGGSHPGYKSHFLVDRSSNTGIVVVANREDVNAYKIALETMAALTGEALPVISDELPDGIYVTETGPWWLEVKKSALTYLDNEDTLYADEGGVVSTRSPTSPALLRRDGDDIIGVIGHAERRFRPAVNDGVPKALSGRYLSPEGAMLEIDGDAVIMGVGPVRQRMALTSLGKGRFLFTLVDGPWTKRILLHRLGENRLELVLSRARMIEYRRLA
ncbi:beta-lactamase family protein [Martelella alba]|uniref:Beta-lactamase family protein n=1 Tax=Martelella alba TaxID=2590451 RepID=A0A506U5M9_9HYPH|nr:serine hydrolase domain-containing protein [Martelella alba]TPW27879.1 beta-lactamase family protein [Martelella alba]